MTDDDTYPVTDRSTVHRLPARGDRRVVTVHDVLDEAFVAQVGIVDDDGGPVVIPMVYGRDGDRLLLHGSVASRLLRRLDAGAPVCVSVTVVDGLVLARSQFHHSVNYRSAVVFGTARRLRGADAAAALELIVDHLVPGRSAEARPADDRELAQTAVLELPITEASAKVRTGGPVDDEADLALDVWAGVLPLSVTAGPPEPGPGIAADAPLPPSLRPYRRPGEARDR